MQKQAKIIAALGLMGALLMGPGMVTTEAAAAQTAQTAAADSTEAAIPYVYTSKEYGYTINCPQKPNVIPAEAIYENKKGEVLIFDNEGYTIKNAWVIIKDAFDEKSMPNLNKISEEEAKKYCAGLMASNGYEAIELISRTKKDKAIYAITAKEVEIDSNGDGKPDMTAKADTQMAVTFFRGNKGGRYSIQLIDNPELRNSAIALFQKGVTTFKEK